MFQKIQEAYECLSDPQERQWYNDHRDQVLGGDDDGLGVDVSKYFSKSSFNGFDDSTNGFYSVFRDAFAEVIAWESEYRSGTMPMFGDSKTPLNEVNTFYSYWASFATSHPFASADEYKAEREYNRRVRRDIEAHNNDRRKEARKKYNEQIRSLVDWVKRRDPRFQAYQAEKTRIAQEKAAELEAKKREREEKDNEKRRQWAEEAKKEAEALKEERRKLIAEARANGQVLDDDDADKNSNELEEDNEEFEDENNVMVLCDLCKKVFKSKKQFDTHCKSKKHLQVVAALKKQFEEQDRMEKKLKEKEERRLAFQQMKNMQIDDSSDTDDDSDYDSEDDESDSVVEDSNSHQDDMKNEVEDSVKHSSENEFENESESDSESEPSIDPLIMLQQQQGGRRNKQKFVGLTGSDSDANVKNRKKNVGDSDDDDWTNNKKGKAKSKAKAKAKSEPKVKNANKQPAVEEELSENEEEIHFIGMKPNVKKNSKNTTDNFLIEEIWKCETCKNVFETRNKLFSHIKEKNHAAYKNVEGGKSKKKR